MSLVKTGIQHENFVKFSSTKIVIIFDRIWDYFLIYNKNKQSRIIYTTVFNLRFILFRIHVYVTIMYEKLKE